MSFRLVESYLALAFFGVVSVREKVYIASPPSHFFMLSLPALTAGREPFRRYTEIWYMAVFYSLRELIRVAKVGPTNAVIDEPRNREEEERRKGRKRGTVGGRAGNEGSGSSKRGEFYGIVLYLRKIKVKYNSNENILYVAEPWHIDR